MLKDCKLIQLPKFTDESGSLSFIENNQHIPFDINRVFYTYNLTSEKERGNHAHKKCEQFIICTSGSFDVITEDGTKTKTFHLDDPSQGLYIPPMVWAKQTNFEFSSVGLVLASDIYDEEDYYRNYEEYLLAKGTN